ncbi:DUF805 domain-containing protein [Paenirhodobacter populi]|uniref:DUF805 domain-containing protein n=1 Tax=Paenirhodobacter populi TaxID=2306993 RepID=A0A443JI50_9RHOB|nr:DUF805 domain-containing protein [Sinirhodobacter populi]RWR10020.1 DUF805 domain-containing protein [Sinirhodobacter populi]RWR11417.1 DUF805 domain-containing protein [Sinirhodobacter populi]RWR20225.1 DUF805 domain-containing protein [Sinirhodobacter populi]RWR30951.1 DUF805 domain-containing protein [Sinirhodobacter populi]
MDFQTAVRKCFKDFATFQGRAPRSEFWWFMLFIFLGQIVFAVLDGLLFGRAHFDAGMGFFYYATSGGPLGTIFSFIVLLPAISVGVRRLHDTNHSGWWLFISLIPLIGSLILLYFFISRAPDAEPEANRFGPPVV